MKSKTLTKTITEHFPFVDSFYDYRDIDYKAHQLSLQFNEKVKFLDLGATGQLYWGCFYLDENEIDVQDVRELLLKAGRTNNQVKFLTEDLKL